MEELDQTVVSQYSNSPRIDALVALFNAAVGTNFLFELFYNSVWNIDTATGYGLDIWGRIVGINRVVTITTGEYFGFSGPAGPSGVPFNQGIFYDGEALTTNFALSDEAYRLLILAKAAANITDGSIRSFNQILLNLFPNRGNSWVQDNQDMTLTIRFSFTLRPFEDAVVRNSGVLPIPTGVTPLISYPP